MARASESKSASNSRCPDARRKALARAGRGAAGGPGWGLREGGGGGSGQERGAAGNRAGGGDGRLRGGPLHRRQHEPRAHSRSAPALICTPPLSADSVLFRSPSRCHPFPSTSPQATLVSMLPCVPSPTAHPRFGPCCASPVLLLFSSLLHAAMSLVPLPLYV